MVLTKLAPVAPYTPEVRKVQWSIGADNDSPLDV